MFNPKNTQQLGSKKSEKEATSSLANITSRQGSLSSNYKKYSQAHSPQTPKFPLHSPITPNVPESSSNFLNFSPIVPSFQEVGNKVDNWLGWENQTIQQELTEALKRIKVLEEERTQALKNATFLEEEKQIWLVEKQEWEEQQVRQTSFLRRQSQELVQVEQLKSELEKNNDNFHQVSLKNEELTQRLNEIQFKNRQLEQKLAQEINQNCRSETIREQLATDLQKKQEELTQAKQLVKTKEEQFQTIITEKERNFQEEIQQKEQEYSQQYNNLRTFQLRSSAHQRTSSLGSSSSSSQVTEDGNYLIFPASRTSSPRPIRPRPRSLQLLNLGSELNRGGYGENGGIISSNFTTTPDQEINNPLENEADNQPSPVISPSPLRVNQEIEQLLTLADDLGADNTNQQLLTENNTLQAELNKSLENQTNLEKAYKSLADEKVEHERLLQRFNEQELAWEKKCSEQEQQLKKFNEEKLAEELRVKEEIAELKYQLAQSNHKTEERTSQAKEILNQKQADYQKLNHDLVEISKALEEKEEENETLKAKIQEGEETNADLANELATSKRTTEKLTRELKDEQDELADEEKENLRLQSINKEKTQEIKEVNSQITHLRIMGENHLYFLDKVEQEEAELSALIEQAQNILKIKN